LCIQVGIRPDVGWWEALETFRKVVLVGFMVMMQRDGMVQFLVAIMIQMMHLTLYISVRSRMCRWPPHMLRATDSASHPAHALLLTPRPCRCR